MKSAIFLIAFEAKGKGVCHEVPALLWRILPSCSHFFVGAGDEEIEFALSSFAVYGVQDKFRQFSRRDSADRSVPGNVRGRGRRMRRIMPMVSGSFRRQKSVVTTTCTSFLMRAWKSGRMVPVGAPGEDGIVGWTPFALYSGSLLSCGGVVALFSRRGAENTPKYSRFLPMTAVARTTVSPYWRARRHLPALRGARLRAQDARPPIWRTISVPA